MHSLLLFAVLAGAASSAETFSDSGTSSVRIVGGGATEVSERWSITNVSYEEAGVVLDGKPETALVRRVEKRSYATADNERRSQFALDLFVRPAELGRGAKPTLHVEATGTRLTLRDRFYETENPSGLETVTELFDLASGRSLLRTTSSYQRVEIPGSPLVGFLGYDTTNLAAGEHGRLVLATLSGRVSAVTFKAKPGSKVLAWAPRLSLVPASPKDKVERGALTLWSQKNAAGTSALSGFSVQLTFEAEGADAGYSVKVPVEAARFNGKEKSSLELP